MAVSILDIDDFGSDDFNIIALHTSLEDYKLAYLVNKYGQLNLEKELIPLTLSKFATHTNFDFFKFEDKNERIVWSLIANKSVIESEPRIDSDINLVLTNTYSDIVLIPEYDTVDYFIKVEEALLPETVQQFISKLNVIKELDAIYELDKNTLVSINNLLF
ncbi:IPExxxVDY family protein [Flavobacterium agricola]|uniref:IPExxxVDY family protein n=1 Tax=Flavobacterium agricola TaxID=2870839 RepID=A0ABY6LX18_9FLAO|nr:IPExxxVDY family protein [Flavobacterium agricola]UYW00877.1 IPExxxVDY family protein [Flavobacterium agricola]